MIDHLGLGRLAVLIVAALVVFGPERLPELAAQLGRGLRQFRSMLDNMSAEVKESLGPEMADFDLKSLHPKTYLASLLHDEPAPDPEVTTAAVSAPAYSGIPPAVAPNANEESVVPAAGAAATHETRTDVFALPEGTDAMTLLANPIDTSLLVAPWDRELLDRSDSASSTASGQF